MSCAYYCYDCSLSPHDRFLLDIFSIDRMAGLASSSESDELSPSLPSAKANGIMFKLFGISYESLFFALTFLNGDLAYVHLPSDNVGSI
jgi:hypothetical protein